MRPQAKRCFEVPKRRVPPRRLSTECSLCPSRPPTRRRWTGPPLSAGTSLAPTQRNTLPYHGWHHLASASSSSSDSTTCTSTSTTLHLRLWLQVRHSRLLQGARGRARRAVRVYVNTCSLGLRVQPAGCCAYQRHRAACPGRAVHTAYRGTPGSPPWPRCTNSAPTCWRSVRTCSMPRAGTAAARTRWASAQRSRRCCGTTACSARSRRVCYRGLQPQTSRQSQAGLLYSHACASPRTGFEAQQLRIVFPWRDAFQPNAKQAEAPALP